MFRAMSATGLWLLQQGHQHRFGTRCFSSETKLLLTLGISSFAFLQSPMFFPPPPLDPLRVCPITSAVAVEPV